MKVNTALFLFRVRSPTRYAVWSSNGRVFEFSDCVLVTDSTVTVCNSDNSEDTLELPLSEFSNDQDEWQHTLLHCARLLEEHGYAEHELLMPEPHTVLLSAELD